MHGYPCVHGVCVSQCLQVAVVAPAALSVLAGFQVIAAGTVLLGACILEVSVSSDPKSPYVYERVCAYACMCVCVCVCVSHFMSSQDAYLLWRQLVNSVWYGQIPNELLLKRLAVTGAALLVSGIRLMRGCLCMYMRHKA